MPFCYPEDPEFAEDRHAERAVCEALRDQLPDDAALFHSVSLLENDRERELDLLVAWLGVGLAVVEVKGGQVTRDVQGWYQSSQGATHKIDSPVVQAQDGKKMLERYLRTYSAVPVAASAHLVTVVWSRPPNARPMAFPYTQVACALLEAIVDPALEELAELGR